MQLSIDAMSGDLGPAVVVAAVQAALREHADLSVTLVGDSAVLEREIGAGLESSERLSICHAAEVVTMDDAPADALRRKKDSSMRVAINHVQAGESVACVSAGNTGALMATAKFVLKMRAGIERPAIIAEIPVRARAHRLFMLDLGANADCTAEMLHQFAGLGAEVATALAAVDQPRIALLNIGSEQAKGNDVIRDAAALLSADDTINYVGFIEGDALFDDIADVVVTDGFSGNVALKTMEGTAALLMHFLRRAFEHGVVSRLTGLIAAPVLKRLKAQLDPRHYNGAVFVGLNGIVVKSHGGADAVAFRHAIDTAILEGRALETLIERKSIERA